MSRIDFDPGRLEGYLKRRVAGLKGPMEVEPIGGGQSNPTFRLRFGNEAVVLRKQPAGELLPSAHAVDREYRVQAALADTDVPVPRMLHLCEDRAVIGTLFYVMEALDGRVTRDSAILWASREERAAMYDAMNDVLARLHRVDWRAAGLEGYGRPGGYFTRQINRWTRQWQASKTREIPEIERLIEWLPAHIPPGEDETTIVHGDFRVGNLMFHPREPRVIAILDWELSTLGHPLADLGFNCILYHSTPEDYGGVMGLDLDELGIPAEDEYVARYCARVGRKEGIEVFHLAFSMFRFAVIFEGIAQRARIGTAAAADAAQVGRLSVAFARHACALIDRRGGVRSGTREPHMTEKHAGASTRASRIIKAGREELYEAFMDPGALVDWLPPGEMTGEIHEFDPRVGGGYRMSLSYPPDERSFRGKTSDREDVVEVRFMELAPPRRIVEAVSFITADPAFFGEMTIVVIFEQVPGGTEVTFLCKNLPPGLRPEDNEAGSRLSLEQLARRFE